MDDAVQWGITHLVFRLGVPFFFISSAYYLGRNTQKGKTTFHTYRIKMLTPFVFWGLVGLAFLAIDENISGSSLSKIVLKLIRSAVFYPPGAMWFLGACMFSSLIIEKATMHSGFFTPARMWTISIVLFLIALICNTYYFVVFGTPIQRLVDYYMYCTSSARNGLFLLLFSWIGFVMGRNRQDNKMLFLLLGVIGLFLLIADTAFTYGKLTKDDSSLFLALPLLVPSIVYFGRKIPIRGNDNTWKHIRKLSTVIYVSHPVVFKLLQYIFSIDFGAVLFVMTSFICALLYFATQKTKIRLLRKIMCQ